MQVARNAVSIKKRKWFRLFHSTRTRLCYIYTLLNPKNGQIMKQIGVKSFILLTGIYIYPVLETTETSRCSLQREPGSGLQL